MRKIKAFIFMLSITLLASISIFSPTNTYAAESKVDSSVLEDIEKEMERFIDSAVTNQEIDNFKVTLRDDIDISQYTEEEIDDLLKKDIELMKQNLLSTEYSLTSLNDNLSSGHEITPFLVNTGGGTYTAQVWAGIPAIGSSTVNQDFRAVVRSGRVSAVTMLGSGYMTGPSWGQYNHVRSWHTYHNNSTKVRIHIKVTINYTFNLVGNGYSATFMEYLRVNGNSLIRDLTL